MSKYVFSIFDGIYDEFLGDVELDLSDELFLKLRSWIEENHADEDLFDIDELEEVDESFAENLRDDAFEYAKQDALEAALREISEDQDNGMRMYLEDVKNGFFIPEGWTPDKHFTVKDAVKRDEYFEEWEGLRPRFGDSGYWDYINERYDVNSLLNLDMISFSVEFPEELFRIRAIC